ncbi:hypothetical protein WN944_007204 [Citrus x changshan-huyou]|uniref:Uncharacterized protein n=1 Tax=Citrus x changshan-huyou TaxID=2935761 RepID=A0AAP0MRY4_9ROSI
MKPLLGMVKLSVDGCSRRNLGMATIGGVLRDHQGMVESDSATVVSWSISSAFVRWDFAYLLERVRVLAPSNVLEASHLFANLASGIAPPAHYVIKENEYNMSYYLADEACQKDVERAFGVLQSRFAIVAGPSRFWNKHVLHDIMTVCIIMHNMIIEDERDVNAKINDWMQAQIPIVDMSIDENTRFQEFLARHKQIKDKEAHIALQNALIDHLCDEFSNLNN